MAFAVSKGWETEVGIGKETTPGTLVTPTLAFAASEVSPQLDVGREEFPGLAGSRVAPKQLDVLTTLAPHGTWRMPLKNEDVDLILELLSGSSASPYSPQNTLSSFSLCADIGPKQIQHAGCKIAQATFSASQGDQILTATIEYIGMSETIAAAGAETIPSPNYSQSPYLFHQATLEIDDTEFYAEGIEIRIANGLIDDVFRNSQTRLEIPEGIATAEGELRVDWNADNYTNLLAALATGTWKKLEATFDDGANHTLKFQFDNIVIPERTLDLAREGAVIATIPWRAKASTVGGTDIYTITVTNPA